MNYNNTTLYVVPKLKKFLIGLFQNILKLNVELNRLTH